jgi:hypothetical protein
VRCTEESRPADSTQQRRWFADHIQGYLVVIVVALKYSAG